MNKQMTKVELGAVLVVAMLASACLCNFIHNPEHEEKILSDAGFKDIQMTGYKPFSCSEDDSLSTGFEAKNNDGKKVSGTVCCGLLFKNCTIRFD